MSFATLPFRRLHESARLPSRAHDFDAGLDLFAIGQHTIASRSIAVIPTGLATSIPVGFYGQIAGRSGLAAKGLTPLGGVIDHGYTGEIRVILHNTTDQSVTVGGDGKAVGQLVVKRCELPRPVWAADELPSTERGEGGFGSTDRPAASVDSLTGDTA